METWDENPRVPGGSILTHTHIPNRKDIDQLTMCSLSWSIKTEGTKKPPRREPTFLFQVPRTSLLPAARRPKAAAPGALGAVGGAPRAVHGAAAESLGWAAGRRFTTSSRW